MCSFTMNQDMRNILYKCMSFNTCDLRLVRNLVADTAYGMLSLRRKPDTKEEN